MPEDLQHLPVGTIVGNGKYRIVRFIAAGGFGCTYEAEFLLMRKRVAIKEFFINSMCNRQATGAISIGAVSQTGLVQKLEEKFLHEAQNIFGLSHPNIVGVKDVFKDLGTSYYVMDYIDGQSLQSLIEERGPLPEAQVMKYMGQVMDALEYVHGKKILHLDLKPDNIMVDSSDRAILIDFGVSKQYDEANGHNTSTILGQTPGYAPIEQMSKNITNFAPSTDIYALGATMYAALTGMAPPAAPDLLAGADTLQPLPPETSMQARRVIEMMMRARSKDRPQSIAEVRALLRQPIYQPQPNPQPQPIPQPNPYQQRQFNPYPQPARQRPYAQQGPQGPHTGSKVARAIFLILAILLTLVTVYYLISIFVYDYESYYYNDYWGWYQDTFDTIDEEYFGDYSGKCLLYSTIAGILMTPCWILFGVFNSKCKRTRRN